MMDGKSWEESPLNVPEDLKESAPKLTQVKTDRVFRGDAEGTGTSLSASFVHPRIAAPSHRGTTFPVLPRRCRILSDGVSS
jgi:hypothetical protein